MEGKIIVYSHETGMGRIMTPDKERFRFSVDEWDDYDHMPSIGQKVHFHADGEEARQIVPLLQDSEPTAGEKIQPPRIPETVASEEDNSQGSVSAPDGLEAEMDPKSCIQEFFDDILQKIGADKELFKKNRTLDYGRMRRFLETAYHNLSEIDQSIDTAELTDLRHRLNNIHTLYRNFLKQTEYLPKAYEEIFLNRQKRYKQMKERQEANRKNAAALHQKATTLERIIKEKNEELQRLPANSDKAVTLVEEIKGLKRGMVDAIHEEGLLNEENALLSDLIERFHKKYFDVFKKEFETFVKMQDKLLRKIRDVLAYQFDALMWKEANRSKAIQSFFAQAGILDDFSAVTYLKHYLKTLDETKLSQENRELKSLLHYLEAQQRKTVVAIDGEIEFLTRLKESIGEIDRQIRLLPATRPETVLAQLKGIKPDILLIDPKMRGIDLERTLKLFHEGNPELDIVYFVDRVDKKILQDAKERGVKAILPRQIEKSKLTERLKKILESSCLQD